MFDKRALNNEIFPLKSKIGRAKVHIINALSKKIKKFKLLLDKSPQNTKLQSRHDSAIEQIHALKKINLREAAKNVIADTSNPLEILKSTTATVDERALAKLYSHEFVVSAVKEIKTKHNLNDENDAWRGFIKDIGEHKKKRKDDLKKKLKEIKKNKKLKSKELKKTNPRKDKTKEQDESTTPLKLKKNKPSKTAVAVADSESDQGDPETQGDDGGGNTDLFFVTQSGENYQSTVKISNAVDDSDNENERQAKHAPKRFPKSNASNKYHDNNSNRTYGKKPYTNDRFQNKNFKQFPNKREHTDETESLHPSWAAKKKQKITDFKGTKISFENGEPTTHKISFNNKPSVVEDKTLHPSWAAKMKQKTLVKEFQGQKIKFED